MGNLRRHTQISEQPRSRPTPPTMSDMLGGIPNWTARYWANAPDVNADESINATRKREQGNDPQYGG